MHLSTPSWWPRSWPRACRRKASRFEAKSVTKGVRTAQKAVESRNYEIRKNVLKYDDVMNKQRTVIYSERQAVLKGEDIHKDILRFISDTVESYIKGANKDPRNRRTGIGRACSRRSTP